MNYAAIVEYNGKNFHGWEYQGHGIRTVQEEVEKALSFVCNEKITAICAGRTDAGVHAAGQVINFTASAARSTANLLSGTNSRLPQDVNLVAVFKVDDSFNARYSAVSRVYQYRILNRPSRSALRADFIWWIHNPLDVGKMDESSRCLVGEKDFSSFRSSICQSKTPMRCLHRVDFKRRRDEIIIEIEGNAFLHHMVRNIVGSLIEVGKGKPASWLEQVLNAKNRKLAGATAPACGLTLRQVRYPQDYAIIAP